MQSGLSVEKYSPPLLSAHTSNYQAYIALFFSILLAYVGKLQFLSLLGAPSYGSHAEQAFVISRLNWRDTQLSRGAWCKTELGVI